jgi:hypothetical protein
VAQSKGKSLSTEQMLNIRGYTYRQIRKQIESGKSTKNLESTYEKQLRKFPLDALAKQHERDLYNTVLLDGKPGELAKVSYETYDLLEIMERRELMRRDPNKYDTDWVFNSVAKARKKAGK